MKTSIFAIVGLSVLMAGSFLLSGCSSKKDDTELINLQKQKEIEVIQAQQAKDLALEAESNKQKEIQLDKLNACFDDASRKHISSYSYTFSSYCPNVNMSDMDEVRGCLHNLPQASLTAFAELDNTYKAEEGSSRTECLKIYPQS